MARYNVEKVSADPAAGGEIVYTADENVIVHACAFTLVTNATVASRIVNLVADDGADVFFSVPAITHVASETRRYSAFAGANNRSNVNVTLELPSTGLRLRKGDRLRTLTTALQAGDDFGPMTLQAERP